MSLIWGTFAFAVGSALFPLLNMEAYLGVAAASPTASTFLLAVAAAVGQMVGKVVWYYAGNQSTRLPWIARKLADPKAQTTIARWEQRTSGRPWFTAAVLFVSAFTGFPPFALMATLAGVIRIPLPIFLVTGLLGRFLRFASIVGAAALIWPLGG